MIPFPIFVRSFNHIGSRWNFSMGTFHYFPLFLLVLSHKPFETMTNHQSSFPFTSSQCGVPVSTSSSSPPPPPSSLLSSPSNNVVSSAEIVVREAAIRIGLATGSHDHGNNVLLALCQSMKEEFVLHEWQLTEIDSSQWKELGAPIGLSAAIRKHCTAKTTKTKSGIDTIQNNKNYNKNYHSNKKEQLGDDVNNDDGEEIGGSLLSSQRVISVESSLRSISVQKQKQKQKRMASTRTQNTRSASQTGMTQSSTDDDPTSSPKDMASTIYSSSNNLNVKSGNEHGNDGHGGDGLAAAATTTTTSHQSQHEDNNINKGKTKQEHKTQQRHYQTPDNIIRLLRAFPNFGPGRPFPIQDTFYRALLHSKSGQELKAHGLFVMELSVVVSALLTGAAVELWASFPFDSVNVMDDGNIGLSKALALSFNSLACCTLLIQFVCTMAWIFFLNVAAAVAPEKYAQFIQQTRYIHSKYWLLVVAGILSFVASSGILFSSIVLSITTEADDAHYRYILAIGFPIAVIVPLFFCIHKFTNYVGRVAFHGFLLSSKYPPVSSPSTLKVGIEGRKGNRRRLSTEAEQRNCKTFHDHVEKDADNVIDLCVKLSSSYRNNIIDYTHDDGSIVGNDEYYNDDKDDELDDNNNVTPAVSQPQHHNRHYFGQEYAIPKYNHEADGRGGGSRTGHPKNIKRFF